MEMRRILLLLGVVMMMAVGMLSGWGLTSGAEARTRTREAVVKGDHNFKYGTSFNKALWTLQRRYPEYLRTFSKDEDGLIDLVEDAPNVMTHYFFEKKGYVGCAVSIYDVDDLSRIVGDYVLKFRKIYRKTPSRDDGDGAYVWMDRNGNRVELRQRMRGDKAVIEIRTTCGGSE